MFMQQMLLNGLILTTVLARTKLSEITSSLAILGVKENDSSPFCTEQRQKPKGYYILSDGLMDPLFMQDLVEKNPDSLPVADWCGYADFPGIPEPFLLQITTKSEHRLRFLSRSPLKFEGDKLVQFAPLPALDFTYRLGPRSLVLKGELSHLMEISYDPKGLVASVMDLITETLSPETCTLALWKREWAARSPALLSGKLCSTPVWELGYWFSSMVHLEDGLGKLLSYQGISGGYLRVVSESPVSFRFEGSTPVIDRPNKYVSTDPLKIYSLTFKDKTAGLWDGDSLKVLSLGQYGDVHFNTENCMHVEKPLPSAPPTPSTEKSLLCSRPRQRQQTFILIEGDLIYLDDHSPVKLQRLSNQTLRVESVGGHSGFNLIPLVGASNYVRVRDGGYTQGLSFSNCEPRPTGFVQEEFSVKETKFDISIFPSNYTAFIKRKGIDGNGKSAVLQSFDLQFFPSGTPGQYNFFRGSSLKELEQSVGSVVRALTIHGESFDILPSIPDLSLHLPPPPDFSVDPLIKLLHGRYCATLDNKVELILSFDQDESIVDIYFRSPAINYEIFTRPYRWNGTKFTIEGLEVPLKTSPDSFKRHLYKLGNHADWNFMSDDSFSRGSDPSFLFSRSCRRLKGLVPIGLYCSEDLKYGDYEYRMVVLVRGISASLGHEQVQLILKPPVSDSQNETIAFRIESDYPVFTKRASMLAGQVVYDIRQDQIKIAGYSISRAKCNKAMAIPGIYGGRKAGRVVFVRFRKSFAVKVDVMYIVRNQTFSASGITMGNIARTLASIEAPSYNKIIRDFISEFESAGLQVQPLDSGFGIEITEELLPKRLQFEMGIEIPLTLYKPPTGTALHVSALNYTGVN